MHEDAWLGERLGCAAWTVESHDTIDDLVAFDPGFLQAKVATGDVARVGALEQAGFRMIDVAVTLRRAGGLPAPDSARGVRDASDEDREAVVAIAQHDYSVSRFHLDPEIPDDVASAIKRDWVDNYFLGARGDRLLVAESDGRVIGFLLVLDIEEASVIDLIAVATPARGGGAGRAMVCELIGERRERPVLVGTQVSNLGALRFYERLGFTVARTEYVLHRHG